jgi:oxygen-independent coproporphyrinogen-3 oxidase
MASLGREAELIADRIDGRATSGSLYFGGGSPALALDFFNPLLKTLEGRFDLRGPRAIELHPSDTSSDTISRLRDLGFDQVSLGAQTFSEGLHARIGRDWSDPAPALGRLASAGFPTLDVDILFGLPGQTEELLEADLRRAVALGATQISTYPFIRFSYTRTPQVIPGIAARRRLLRHLTETATELGLERRSIWTFARPDTPGYSSVTRDNFIGFGASAASLLPDIFRINTFSVPAYIAAIGEGRIPTALTLVFTARTRALFWLFWSCYRTIIRGADYEGLFGRSLEADFGFELSLGRLIGLFEGGEGEYVLTRRGRYLFHLVEQAYTSDYIDRTWSTCRSEPWPKGLELR